MGEPLPWEKEAGLMAIARKPGQGEGGPAQTGADNLLTHRSSSEVKAEPPEWGLLHEVTEGTSDHSGLPGLDLVPRASLVWPLMRVSFVQGRPDVYNGALALEPPPAPVDGIDHPGSRECSFKQTVNSEMPVS